MPIIHSSFFMFKTLQKLVGQKNKLPAQHLILLHARIHRVLKSYIKPFLSGQQLSLLDWSLLDILNTSEDGCRLNRIAHELCVEASLVTELIHKLGKKHLLESTSDVNDRRAKVVTLTDKGRQKIAQINKLINDNAGILLTQTSPSESNIYRQFLEKILTTSHKEKMPHH